MSKTKVTGIDWGKNLKDWTEIQEKQGLSGFAYVLKSLPDTTLKLLDVGCGSGTFCGLALSKNLEVTGVDMSSQFVEEAKSRFPKANFLCGNMENLPFENKTFDVVSGFNSFQYADNLKAALKESKRILTDYGKLIILIWGPKNSCEIASFLTEVKSRLKPVPSESRNPFALSDNDTLENTLTEIGFTNIESVIIESSWHYENLDVALKGLLSLGALANTIEHNDIENVKEAILQSITPYTQSSGSVVFKNYYRIVTAG